MRLILANLLLRYTKCSAHTQGTSVSLVWKSELDTFSWSLHASKNMRVILHRNTLRMVKHYPKQHKHYD